MKQTQSSQIAGRVTIVSLLLALVTVSALGWRNPQAAPAAATEKRIDTPFTLAVKTPHVSWGVPWGGAPIHVLVVPSVSEGRTLVELAERFPLTYDTIMIDSAWDVNTWTVGTGKNYEARNYKLLYHYLAEDLDSNAHYNVIVLPSLFGWNRLPMDVRDGILTRVKSGAGLVLIHPTTGIPAPDDPKTTRPMNDLAPDYSVSPGGKLWEVSPLVGVLSDRLNDHGFLEVRSDAVTTGAWRAARSSFITNNVPFASFPGSYLKHYKYQLGRNSTALVVGPDGEPIVGAKRYGKGRVVALGYLNHGLSPEIDWSFLGKRNDRWWEYFYSLIGRSIIWAAHREPPMTLLPMKVESAGNSVERVSVSVRSSKRFKDAVLTANVVNQWGDEEEKIAKTIRVKKGVSRTALDLPRTLSCGRHEVDVILSAGGKHYDWGSATIVVPQPDEIVSVTTNKQFYSLGDPLRATIVTRGSEAANLKIQLWDNRGRLIGARTATSSQEENHVFQATFRVGNYTTNIGWVRVALIDVQGRKIDQKQARVDFVTLDRKFGAYELILPWHGPPSYEPWNPALEAQFRKLGVTVVEEPRDNFKLISEVHAPGFGVYWHYRRSYLEQKDRFLQTHDTKYLIREPDLSSHAWLDKLRGIIIDSMQKTMPYRPLAYYLADESSLTAYGDPLDFSWSKPTLAAFRRWLKGQYPSLGALNAEWETDYKTWDSVMPLTTRQAQVKGDYAGWMDHRTFMEQVFARAMEVAAETVRAEDPGGLPSISGTQVPGPSNAVNWYLLDHIVGYLQPYSDGDQDDLHRSIHANQILTGFTGYESAGVELRHQLWQRLFHGQTGASLFWQYTALNADLTLTEQGRDLASLTHEFRDDGLALLLHGAKRENCGIAVHYSLLSVRSHWITDGHIAAHEVSNGDKTSFNLRRFHQNRTQWLQALRDAGYQYDFVTTEQIDKGRLSDYKVLILPDSISLSEAEVAAIRNFVASGGLLISNGVTGLMDGHARWQHEGLLNGVLGIQQNGSRARSRKSNHTVELNSNPGSKSIDGAELIPVNLKPVLTTGQVEARAGQSPTVIDNAFGAGRSDIFNFWMTNYDQLRKAHESEAVLRLLEADLTRDGVFPVADVRTASAQPLQCSEVIAYQRGVVRYLAVLPEIGCPDAGQAAVMKFPQASYVYDLRAHRYLGRVSSVTVKLPNGEPLFLALSSEPLGKLNISVHGPSKGLIKAGGNVSFVIQMTNLAAAESFPDAIHIEVRNPDGKVVGYYGRNLPLVNDAAYFSVATAMNDQPGVWKISASEPYTHESAEATFTVAAR